MVSEIRLKNFKCVKNSFATILIKVYTGKATTMPKIPPIEAAIKVTKKISKGCALTEFEKIKG